MTTSIPGASAKEGSPYEHQNLLGRDSIDDELSVHTDSDSQAPTPPPKSPPYARKPLPQRQVRFNIDDRDTDGDALENGGRRWMDDEDYMYSDDDEDDGGQGSGTHRAPLLTAVEAPSVSLAEDIGDLLDNRPKSGMKMAFMNMANSIIGAGIIGQPYAMRQAGLVTGAVLLLLLTVMVDWTIRLIVVNSKLSGANSFQATVEKCFGKWGLIAISLAQWAFAFGGMIAFCIIIGDTIPHVVAALFPSIKTIPVLRLLVNRRAAIVLFTIGTSYPLSLYRDIAKLAKASALALVSMAVIVVTVAVQGPLMPKELKGDFTPGTFIINDGIFQAIGVISFAFVCHHNSLLIYGSLRKPTLDRFARVTHFSTGISFVFCLIMALTGFMVFKDKTQGNVLNNFPSDNFMVNIARFCFGLNMLTTLPLECFVCREVMENYYWPDQPYSQRRHFLITTGLVLVSMSFSLMTCDLGAVFEIIGATSACALAYILPPLCFIKLSTKSWKTVPAVGIVVFGTVVMVISLVQSVQKLITGHGSTTKCDW